MLKVAVCYNERMEKTIIGNDIGRQVTGYMINAELDDNNKTVIGTIQKKIVDEFGGAIWPAPRNSLHITLLDWLAPLVDYGADKDELFQNIRERYDEVLSASLARTATITVTFNTINVGRSAIFISGQDNGEFARIRQEFVDGVTLLPGTKLPPTIIHSTICRFNEEIEMPPIENLVDKLSIDLAQQISRFRLVRETVDPMLEFEMIKEYPLQPNPGFAQGTQS
jgi:hypothetical protein